MALNSLAHAYEEATIRTVRPLILDTLRYLPPLRPDMHVLDHACGSGSVTRVIYEHCAALKIQPPRITAVDVGPNFIDAFEKNKLLRKWDTVESILCDAAHMSMIPDNTFDIIIMSFGLFAIPDKDTDQACKEMYRILKPGGRATFTTWRESFAERMFFQIPKAVSRPPEEFIHGYNGKWLRKDVPRQALVAGGFPRWKLQTHKFKAETDYGGKDGLVEFFAGPLWKGQATAKWPEELKSRWEPEFKRVLTEEEAESGCIQWQVWLTIADKEA